MVAKPPSSPPAPKPPAPTPRRAPAKTRGRATWIVDDIVDFG